MYFCAFLSYTEKRFRISAKLIVPQQKTKTNGHLFKDAYFWFTQEEFPSKGRGLPAVPRECPISGCFGAASERKAVSKGGSAGAGPGVRPETASQHLLAL